MILTDPRAKIIRGLVVTSRLSVSLIYELLAAKNDSRRRSARHCLKQLTEKGIVRREPLIKSKSFLDNRVHWEYLYMLTPKGVTFARNRGLDLEKVAIAPETKSPWELEHEAAIAAFHAALVASFQDAKWWQREEDLKQAFTWNGKTYLVNPDALFYVNRFCYFLEYERGGQGAYTRGESQRLRKFRNFDRYARSRAFRERHPGMADFFLVMVVDSTTRRDNLLRSLKEKKLAFGRFKICTEEDYRRDIAGPIWYSANGKITSLR